MTLTMGGLHVSAEPATSPAIFIFGDSTVDIGTNNFIPESGARADMPHNGVDYHGSPPTGRFSNGYNTADSIVRLMGFKESPPSFLYILYTQKQYLTSIQNFTGLNFASGGSGLLDNTGKVPYTKVVPMGEQVQQFATVGSNLSEALGGDAETKIRKSIFLISVGSNDMFEHFNLTHTCEQDFMTSLITNYSTHLKNLLDLGATKFGIISVAPIGCCPYQRSLNETAFKEIQQACCGKGRFNATTRCEPDANLCPDRDEYMFWDQFHPTEFASQIAAALLYAGPQQIVAPINFGQLYMLDN
ncbi:hypothetical protein SLA2020_432990 [Shorea laevis]